MSTYIRRVYRESLDDKSLEYVKQLSADNEFEIYRPDEFIAERVYSDIRDIIDSAYSYADILAIVRMEEASFNLMLAPDEKDAVLVYISVTKNAVKVDVTMCNGMVQYIYNITRMAKGYVAYLVCDQIVAPFPKVGRVLRCYHETFNRKDDAIRYRNQQRRNPGKPNKGSKLSDFEIYVVNRYTLDNQFWYHGNLEAARLILNYELNFDKYRYVNNVETLLNYIYIDTYDIASDAQKAKINRKLYECVGPFLNDDIKSVMDEYIDECNDSKVEQIVNDALAISLTSCVSKKEFQKLQKAIGPYSKRLKSLTQEIFNDHMGQGYILCTKTGELGWFPSCEFIEDWDGAKDNPYRGKFMKNDGEILLCFKEYHPEMLVTRLPTRKEMSDYRMLYKVACSKERMAHDELEFEDHFLFGYRMSGIWYEDGVFGDKSEFISISAEYGGHKLTRLEACELLSGNEVTIEDFVSQMGIVCSATIKIGKDIDMFGEVCAKYIRTDIKRGV